MFSQFFSINFHCEIEMFTLLGSVEIYMLKTGCFYLDVDLGELGVGSGRKRRGCKNILARTKNFAVSILRMVICIMV